jgi:DNA-directed RNA polymerase specialized sigma24 family protein
MGEKEKQTVIQMTQTYLENYREMERYINDAVSEVWQVPDIQKYNISAEQAYIQSIRGCRAETMILFEHINKALQSLKEDAIEAGEGYKYEALEAIYIRGESYEDIAQETGCGRNSPKRWCKTMIERLSVKLFGVKAIMENRTETSENTE